LVLEIAECVGIDPSSLRQHYSEPLVSSDKREPGLPSKAEVEQRYLDAMRELRGAVAENKLRAKLTLRGEEAVI